MQERTAIIFVSDKGFAIPTVCAAIQIREQIKNIPTASVFVVWTGLKDFEIEVADTVCKEVGINSIQMGGIKLPQDVLFNITHVSETTLGRFIAVQYLPEQFKNIIYLDGDVQIIGDISELLLHRVKDGYIAAANDKYWLGDFGRKRSQQRYLRGLDVDPEEYFNAGVLCFRRETWVKEAPRALQFFIENSKLCRYHDQSALNVIFKDKREVLHPKFNFITDYVLFSAERMLKPSIFHFTGGLKPWYYRGAPWNGRFSDAYSVVCKQNPALLIFQNKKLPDELRGMEKSFKKQFFLHNYAFPLLPIRRRNRMMEYINNSHFDVS